MGVHPQVPLPDVHPERESTMCNRSMPCILPARGLGATGFRGDARQQATANGSAKAAIGFHASRQQAALPTACLAAMTSAVDPVAKPNPEV